MKRFLAALLFLVPLTGQWLERPAMGHYVDRQGGLRELFGVPGSLTPGAVRAAGVVSASAFQGWLVWKTEDAVFLLRQGAEEPRSWPAPAGKARFALAPDGVCVWFEDAERGWCWDAALDDFSEQAWLGQDAFPEYESLGRWSVVRTEQGLFLANGSDVFAIPEPADDGPQLFEVVGQEEVAITGEYNFPPTGPGDTVIKRFRVRNPGQAALNIVRLTVSAGVFAITDGFTVPRLIPGGRSEDFWIRFAPQASGTSRATLTINTTAFALSGNAPEWPQLETFDSGRWVAASVNQALDLGSMVRGGEVTRPFRVSNRNSGTITVPAPVLTGAAFVLADAWASPRDLAPGAAAEFVVRFQPVLAGPQTAELRLGPQRFPLRATGVEYPLPRPAISMVDRLLSGRQEKIVVRLAEPARSNGTGLLRLQFTPEGSLPDDPSIVFPSNGTRTAIFQVKEGSDTADFSGQDGILLQTGTTAGAVNLTVTLGSYTESKQMPITAQQPVIASSQGLKAELSLEVQFTAFDNTRAASQLAFTFYLRNGQVISPGRIPVDISGAMRDFFVANPRGGGIFSLRAHFPVSGSTTEIDRVDVEIQNPAGITKLDTIKF